MPARAVIFDLDGTLVDSLDDIADALGRSLDDAGLPVPGLGAVRTWIGAGARNLVAQAAPAARVDDVYAGFQRHYGERPIVRTSLFPGVAGVLDGLAQRGTPMAVLSNKPHALTVRIADALLARWRFAAVVGHRPGAPLKPDPTAALEVAAALGVSPDACAFVGDSAIDIATARAAGMRPIAVTWGYRPRAELIAAGPDALVDDPHELATAL
jgi:phosphoglycolate phosphatase